MCDVRKSFVRLVAMGLAAGLLSGAVASARAQVGGTVDINRKPKQQPAPGSVHRETNASRQARIDRTIAQTYSHKWEVGGGGGYLRWRGGPVVKRNNEISWDAYVDRYISTKLAIVGTAQGSFGNAHTILPSPYPNVTNPQINEYFFMGGANYRFYRREKFAVSAQAVGGVGWGIFSGGDKGITSATLLGLWQDGWRPAFSVSANLDYNIYPNLGLRVSPTWIGTTFSSGSGYPSVAVQSNFGFNAGFFYRFGTH